MLKTFFAYANPGWIATPFAITAAAIVSMASVGPARADVITTFTLPTAGLQDGTGGTIKGSFEIDETTFNYVAGSSTLQVSGVSSPFLNDPLSTFVELSIHGILFEDPSDTESIGLAIGNGTTVTENGLINIAGELVINGPSGDIDVFTGQETASTPVPEPSSLILIATGLAALGAVRRRRRTRAPA